MAKQYIIEAQRLQKLAGIKEIKIIPHPGKGLSKKFLVKKLEDIFDDDPYRFDFDSDSIIRAKHEISKLKIIQLIVEFVLLGPENELDKFYKIYNKIVIDGKDFTDWYEEIKKHHTGINEIKIVPQILSKEEPELPSGWKVEKLEDDDEDYYGNKTIKAYILPHQTSNSLFDIYLSIKKTPEGKYYISGFYGNYATDIKVKYDTFAAAEEAAIIDMEEINQHNKEYDDDDRYIDEVKIIPVSMGGVSKVDIVNQIIDYYDEDPDFYHDAGFNNKQDIKDFYSKFKNEDLVEFITMSSLIFPILIDYYEKHNRVVIDGKDYTDLYLKTVEKYS